MDGARRRARTRRRLRIFVVERVFAVLDPRVVVAVAVTDGERVAQGTVVATISGPLRAMLTGERTALNLLSHLSGVATATSRLVRAVAGTRATIVDTRKTTPGMRALEKAAVRDAEAPTIASGSTTRSSSKTITLPSPWHHRGDRGCTSPTRATS